MMGRSPQSCCEPKEGALERQGRPASEPVLRPGVRASKLYSWTLLPSL